MQVRPSEVGMSLTAAPLQAQVVLDTLEYGSAIKKTPVVVGNCTGFAVNRVFFPYTQAACLLVDLGLDPYKVDKAVLGGFGMPMGPFRCARAGWNMLPDPLDRLMELSCVPGPVWVSMVFPVRTVHAWALRFWSFSALQAAHGTWPHGGEPAAKHPSMLVSRLLAMVVG